MPPGVRPAPIFQLAPTVRAGPLESRPARALPAEAPDRNAERLLELTRQQARTIQQLQLQLQLRAAEAATRPPGRAAATQTDRNPNPNCTDESGRTSRCSTASGDSTSSLASCALDEIASEAPGINPSQIDPKNPIDATFQRIDRAVAAMIQVGQLALDGTAGQNRITKRRRRRKATQKDALRRAADAAAALRQALTPALQTPAKPERARVGLGIVLNVQLPRRPAPLSRAASDATVTLPDDDAGCCATPCRPAAAGLDGPLVARLLANLQQALSVPLAKST